MVTFFRKIIMKNSIFIFLCMFYYSAAQQSNQEFFEQAATLFDRGLFDQARHVYEKISPKGPAVWFNMGVCCYQSNDHIQALTYWRRAQMDEHAEIYTLCDQWRARLPFQAQPPTSFLHTVYKMSIMYAPLVWQIVFLILWTLCWAIGTFVQRYKRISLVFLCAPLWCMGLILMVHYNVIMNDPALVHNETALYIAPQDSFAGSIMIAKGSEIEIEEQQEGWYKIAYQSHRGWIPAQHATRIKELT